MDISAELLKNIDMDPGVVERAELPANRCTGRTSVSKPNKSMEKQVTIRGNARMIVATLNGGVR